MRRGFADDARGAAAIEFAVAAAFIVTALLNAADIGSYIYQSMQVENAAQMAVQTAVQACAPAEIPVTTACPAFAGRLAAAVAATSLGKAVIVDPGQPVEAWFCVDRLERLVPAGALGAKPASCKAAGSAAMPGVYVSVTVSYAFEPLLAGASLAALLETPIRRSAIMRVG